MRILVMDGDHLSVIELTRALGGHRSFGTKLVSMLTVSLRVLGRLMGLEVQISRLNQGNRSHQHVTLGWRESYNVDAGLSDTAPWYCIAHSISLPTISHFHSHHGALYQCRIEKEKALA